ncbi:MAG: hypothetical protein A2007_05025 [Verrucomicrobia bacterium GWC2_42_7]|nr:MAG: hypothetical protein A2007_05025 [Verrucomicrobia bacterium GWC2_42_7]
MNISNEEIYFIDYEKDTEKKIIYAPLRSYIALISKTNANIFLAESSSDVRAKILKKIVSRPLIDPQKILHDLRRCTPELSVPITNNCNLRCLYCHASAGEEHKTESMSEAMIDAVLNCYFKEIPENTKKVMIHFLGGGEPTYKFEELSYAVNKANNIASQRGIKCVFTMATNGCYGQKIREFVVNNFSEVSLSFDGPAHIQNFHRPLIGGLPSFDLVYETAQYFRSVNFNFALRVTVSDYSLPYLTDVLDFFEQKFPDAHLGLEPLVVSGRALKNTHLKAPDAKVFGDKLLSALKYTDKKSITVANSAATEYHLIRPVFCTAIAVPNWTIQLNGDIVCCARDGAPNEFTFGHLDFKKNEVIIDESKLDNIRKMNVFSYDECKDCFTKYHCAGDCPDRRISGKSNCDSLREIGKFILNKKMDVV